MDPLRAALAPPPDSKVGLARLRAARAAWMCSFRELRRRGNPDAARVVLALDPVLVLDEGFERYGALLEDALRLAPEAGPRVFSGLLRAHARIWTLRGGHRVARRALAEARRIAASAASEEPVSDALITFGAAHAAFGLGLTGELTAETGALRGLASGAAGTPASLRIEALASQAEGLVAMSRGAHAGAVDAFEHAVDWARRAGAERTLAIGLANRGLSLRDQGRPDAAAASLLAALALFRSIGDPVHAALTEGFLLLLPDPPARLDVPAVLRAASRSERLGDARTAAGLLLALVERERPYSRDAQAASWLDRAWSLLARVDAPSLEARARRLTETFGPSPDAPATVVLEVASDGTRATLAGRAIDLRSRRALPRVLLALARARVETEGAHLSVPELFAAGWPGEKALEHAAAARVYMAVRALRTLGLSEAITTSPAGYRIDPALPVRLGSGGI